MVKSKGKDTFKDEVRAFMQEQRENWKKQWEFNKFVLEQFKKHGWIK